MSCCELFGVLFYFGSNFEVSGGAELVSVMKSLDELKLVVTETKDELMLVVTETKDELMLKVTETKDELKISKTETRQST